MYILLFFNIFRSEKEANYDEIVETLEKKLSNSAVENQAKGEEVNSELLRNVENERDSLKNEFDQVSFVFIQKKLFRCDELASRTSKDLNSSSFLLLH